MQTARNFVESLIKFNKVVIFVDNLKDYDEEIKKKNLRVNSDLTDLLRVYKLDDKYITIKYIADFDDPLTIKSYLNTLCKRNSKIQYPLIFINGKFFGSYSDLNKKHDEGKLFDILCQQRVIKHTVRDGIKEIKNYESSHNHSFNMNSNSIPNNLSSFYTKSLFDLQNDDDLDAINEVTLSNLDMGKSISELLNESTTEQFKKPKKYFVSSNCPSGSSNALRGSVNSKSTWGDTTCTMSSQYTNINYKYCLNFIKSNYPPNKRKTKQQQQQQQDATDTDLMNNRFYYSTNNLNDKRPGLTPNGAVLTAINNRLCRADEAIQNKNLNILSRKVF